MTWYILVQCVMQQTERAQTSHVFADVRLIVINIGTLSSMLSNVWNFISLQSSFCGHMREKKPTRTAADSRLKQAPAVC